MYDRFGVRLSLIGALPAIAEAHGVPLPFVMAFGGLREDALAAGGGIAARSQVCAVLQGLARKSGDVTVGFQMAAATHPAMLGPNGEALLAGRTLGEALALQIRYMPWLQRGLVLKLESFGQRAQWTHRMLNSDPLEARFLNEGIAAFIVWCVRAISGKPDARMHVVLPHRPLAPLRKYEDALHCAVSFIPGTALIVRFDAALLDCPNVLMGASGAGPDPVASVEVPADFALTDDDLLQALQRMFGAAAMMGRLSLRSASAMLGVPPRSLQRRLAEMDTTFEEVADDWRRQRARAMLARPETRTDEVAATLGYADASHFIRAFRRWEGLSPGQFRATTDPARDA